MTWQSFTGDGLNVGWTEVQPDDSIGVNSGPFHPNDFYSLIRPTMLQGRWTYDVTLGEISEDEWQNEFIPYTEELSALRLNLRESETGRTVELSSVQIVESNG